MHIGVQEHMATVIWENEKGTFLRVIARPNSKEKNFVAEISSEGIVVNLKSPAKEGKANSELLRRMAKLLRVSTGNIRLVTGHKSKEKTLLIDGFSLDDIKEKLASVT